MEHCRNLTNGALAGPIEDLFEQFASEGTRHKADLEHPNYDTVYLGWVLTPGAPTSRRHCVHRRLAGVGQGGAESRHRGGVGRLSTECRRQAAAGGAAGAPAALRDHALFGVVSVLTPNPGLWARSLRAGALAPVHLRRPRAGNPCPACGCSTRWRELSWASCLQGLAPRDRLPAQFGASRYQLVETERNHPKCP